MKSFFSLAVGLLLGFSATVVAQTTFFPDVNSGDWFYEYVMEIKDWGVVSGNDDGTFAPARNINRAEFSKMLSLYDGRVDEKIETATANFDLPEPATAPNLPSVMYLEHNHPSNMPPACPEDWEEIDLQRVWNYNNDNMRRTCMTEEACEVLYLEARQTPADCPADWTEAAFEELTSKNNRRTCYVCQ